MSLRSFTFFNQKKLTIKKQKKIISEPCEKNEQLKRVVEEEEAKIAVQTFNPSNPSSTLPAHATIKVALIFKV